MAMPRNEEPGIRNQGRDRLQVSAHWSPLGSEGTGIVPLRRVRDDALPENINYADTGCDIWHRCLTCPLRRCRYDEPGGVRRLINRARDRQITRLKQEEALPVNDLARRYGLSRRSVFRILRKANGAPAAERPPPKSA